jgi:hypothetical protein
MGNRAVITTAPFDEKNVGIYVHWNGGQESIEGFLAACKELGYRDPTGDTSYGLARLTQAIGLFFGAEDDCSVGIGRCDQLDCDNGDNGVWLLGPDWTIAGRLGRSGETIEVEPVSQKDDVEKRDAIKNDILKLTAHAKRDNIGKDFTA